VSALEGGILSFDQRRIVQSQAFCRSFCDSNDVQVGRAIHVRDNDVSVADCAIAGVVARDIQDGSSYTTCFELGTEELSHRFDEAGGWCGPGDSGKDLQYTAATGALRRGEQSSSLCTRSDSGPHPNFDVVARHRASRRTRVERPQSPQFNREQQ
jgi:hypothetical protein